MPCLHVYFSGHIQGVGFRYTTNLIANGFDVSGYVKNLPDGRVELLIEGTETETQCCLDAICERMSGFIRNHVVISETETGSHSGFSIRR